MVKNISKRFINTPQILPDMAKRDSTQLKWKKKKWIDISAPTMFQGASLGQALADDPQNLIGRIIQANMMNVVRNPKMQNITMSFRINDVKEKNGSTESVSYVMAPASIKRLVRSRRDRIDDSVVVGMKDKKVRVKPLIVTQFNNAASQQKAVRALARQELAHMCKDMTFEQFVDMVVRADVQKALKRTLSSIVPIRMVEIRAFSVVDGKKAKHVIEAVERPKEEVAAEETSEEKVSEEASS